MTKKHKYNAVATLERAGISYEDAAALRRASLTLHRWFEHECNGTIQRDEESGKAFWYNADTGHRLYQALDRETGALKRIAAIMAKYAPLDYYVQGDPRGAALYILRPGDVPEGQNKDAYYSRGIVVY